MARGGRRYRVREGSKAVPLTSGLASRIGTHLHRVCLHPRLSAMATYSVRGSQYHSPRYGQRQCKERRRLISHGTRLVWVRFNGGDDNRPAGDDSQYQADPAIDGR